MNREDIIEKVFPHSLFGYDPVAVDSFLDEVIREFDRMTNTIDVLQFRLSQELGEARQMNDCLTHMLSRSEFEGRVEQLIASGHEEPAPAATQEGHGALSSADEEEHHISDETPESASEAFSEAPSAEELELTANDLFAGSAEPENAGEGEQPAQQTSSDEDEGLDAPAFSPETEAEPAAEEIQLMTRREIKKMVREEKALERRVRRKNKKGKK